MHQILHLDSSPQLRTSASRRLTAYVVEALLRESNGAARVVRRDLAQVPVPHLQERTVHQLRNVASSEEPDTDIRLTEELLQELQQSDTLVIGAPMYNFTIPTQLKAWVDRIAWTGKTFRYTPQGPVGLCTGKRAYVVSTRGGVYSTPDKLPWDFQEPYLRAVLGFIGITDFHLIRAEGLALSPDSRDVAIARARERIDEVVERA